jgi:anti-sigma B factor antagonist
MSEDLFYVTPLDRATVVELALPPSLDSEVFDQLNDSLLKLIGQTPHGRWVFDLSRLSYLGSAALGLMINLRQQVKDAGGILVLCGLSPRLASIFRTCCLERLFLIRTNRNEALREMALG